jgi:hypothetical protein
MARCSLYQMTCPKFAQIQYKNFHMHQRTSDFEEEAELVRGTPPREADVSRGAVGLPGGDFFAPAEPQLSPFSQVSSKQQEGMPDHYTDTNMPTARMAM